ncbi:MAG: hypothetical protein K2K63_07425 [Acetatifactor sp.]|nr:hypothetical protein [Acetatifactor sp.]
MKKRILSILLICLLTVFLLGVGRADGLTGDVTWAEQEEMPWRGETAEQEEMPWRGETAEQGETPGRDKTTEQGKKEPSGSWVPDVTEKAETGAEDEILTRLREDMPVYSTSKPMGVSRLEGTEEDLLALIYNSMKIWDNAGGRIQGQIDLSFEGLALASLECNDARQVFIALPEGIYRISANSFHDRDEWKELVQGILEDVFADRNLGREQTEDFFSRIIGCSGQLVLWYRGMHYRFDRRWDQFLLSWERGEDGISFQEACRGSSWKEGDAFSRRIFEFRRLEGLHETESGREMREQLQEMCPDMKTCYILWTQDDEAFIAEAECPGAESLIIYGTSGIWQEEVYQIRCTNREGENDTSGIEELMWENTGLDGYYWTCNEGAVLRESDDVGGYAVYRNDIGQGKPYTFFIHPVEEGETPYQYELAVYEEGEEQPFCRLEIEKEPGGGRELSFDDLNGDGYKDILLGDDPVEKCYLWSASGGRYVEMTEALGGCFEYYRADKEKRQLQVYRSEYVHGGRENFGAVYQWTGETDCELLKDLHQESICDREGEDWREITITVRKDGADKVLVDYIYPSGEYSVRAAEINEIWDMDFVWEQEVKVKGEKNPCILRYAQEETREEDGTLLYTDRWFLFRWDTYLIGSYSGVVSSSLWKEISTDEAGRLRVTYKDGSSVVYSREFYE